MAQNPNPHGNNGRASPVYNPGPPVHDGPGELRVFFDACREIGSAAADGNERMFSVAMHAIPAQYRREMLQMRIFDLNGECWKGQYPLASVAAHFGHHVFLRRQILSRVGGMNANIRAIIDYDNNDDDPHSETPIFAASMSDDNTVESTIEVIRVLHLFGADLNQRDSDNYTPMMMAAAGGWDVSIIEVLHELAREGGTAVDDSVDINATAADEEGTGQWTALDRLIYHYAPLPVPADVQTRMAALGALTGRQVRRRRVCRKAMRVLLQRRLVRARNKWLVEEFKAAKARVDFAPGGTGAAAAAASWAAGVATAASRKRGRDAGAGAGAGAGAKRARNE